MLPELQIDMETLISLVQQRPGLWDRTLDIYKDKKATKQTWREIFPILKHDFKDLDDLTKDYVGKRIIKKWAHVRDNWLRSCKKELQLGKSDKSKTLNRKYIFHRQLQFLMKVYKHELTEDGTKQIKKVNIPSRDRQTTSKNKQTRVSKVKQATSQKEKKTFRSATQELITRDSQEPTKNTEDQRNKSDEIELKILKALKENSTSGRHFSFFKSILPIVKKFDDDQTIEFQAGVIQVMKIVKNQKAESVSHIDSSSVKSNISTSSHSRQLTTKPSIHVYQENDSDMLSPASLTSVYSYYSENSVDLLDP